MDAANNEVSNALSTAINTASNAAVAPTPPIASEETAPKKLVKPAKILVREHVRTVSKPAATAESEFGGGEVEDPEEEVEVSDDEESPKPATAAEATPSKHSTYILRMAKDLGLTDGEIEQYEVGELGAYVHGMVRHLQSEANRGQPRGQQHVEPVAEVEEPITIENEDDIAPEIVREMKADKQALRETNKRLERMEKMLAQNAQQTYAQQLDSAFESLNNPEAFGSGPITGMTRGDLKAQRRMMVESSLRQSPIRGVSLTEAVQRRAKELFPTASTKKTPVAEAADEDDTPIEPRPEPINRLKTDPLTVRKKKWIEEGPVAVPTKRAGAKEPKGVNSAKKHFLQSLRSQGLDGVSSAVGEEDESIG